MILVLLTDHEVSFTTFADKKNGIRAEVWISGIGLYHFKVVTQVRTGKAIHRLIYRVTELWLILIPQFWGGNVENHTMLVV